MTKGQFTVKVKVALEQDLCYHLKEDELLGASVMYGGGKKYRQHFGREPGRKEAIWKA